MTFPETLLPIQVELMIDGAWSDISDDVYYRDAIDITRGRSAEGATVDPGQCSLTLNNREGTYSPRNPLSSLYGKIGRNTPIRVSVNTGASYLTSGPVTPGYLGAYTPDASVIDITGDIDIRLDATLSNWFSLGNDPTAELVGKFRQTTNNRSWLFMARDGKLRLEWSTAGTSTIGADSTVLLPVTVSRRLAVRVTLDVNNGASGNTVTFYTAPTIAGPWEQLGDPVVTSGTTSIFNSTAELRVGNGGPDLAFTPATGMIHAFELYDGIDGTLVANPDFTTQTPGTTSFTDTAGRTWTPGEISNRKTRFVGEVPSWPLESDTSGKDVTVKVEAAGILRRLGQGQQALDSTLRRRIPSDPNLLAYWPMEDGTNASRAASPISGVEPLTLTHATWASEDSLASSKALPVLASDNGALPKMSGHVPAPTGSPAGWIVKWLYRLDTAPTTLWTFMRVLCAGGTIAEWYIQTRSDLTRVFGRDSSGVTQITQDITTGSDLFGQWIAADFSLSASGSTITWKVAWQAVGGQVGVFTGTYTGTIGHVTAVSSPPDGYSSNLDGMALGHITVVGSATTTAFDGAVTAYAQETAGTRMQRLSTEEDIPVIVLGDSPTQVKMGAQLPETFLGLVQECADADHGILYEDRDTLQLAYQGRAGVYNQTPVQLTYGTDLVPPLTPLDDDQLTANDITVTRQGGSSGRATMDEGPLSTLAPPDGVRSYPDSATLNLYEDPQTSVHAGFLLRLGTVDEPRSPVVNLSLSRNPELIDTVTALDSGARLQILEPAARYQPDAIDLLVQGYKETLAQDQWDMAFNCTPGSPWTVGEVSPDDGSDPTAPGRADTAGSILADDVTSTASVLVVSTVTGPVWTADLTDLPFDVRVGGEVVTVTDITGAVGDRFERVVSSGWGTATSGQAWSTSGGSASDFSVAGG